MSSEKSRPEKMSTKNKIAALIAVTIMFLPHISHASLGDIVTPGEAKASTATGQAGVGVLRQVDSVSGVTLAEYVNANNQVFAVAWSGNQIPDLKNVFGSYFDEYSNAWNHRHSLGLHTVHLETPDLKVDISGVNGTSHGLVWLPALVPQGVVIHELWQ
jgi:hypothetical protein